MKTVFVLLSLSLSPHHSSSSEEKHSCSLSKQKHSDRKAELRLLHRFPGDEVLFFIFWWWTLSAPRHLITFWWARKSKLYTTWKPGLSWEARINHHDSVFVCHLCRMKQVYASVLTSAAVRSCCGTARASLERGHATVNWSIFSQLSCTAILWLNGSSGDTDKV